MKNRMHFFLPFEKVEKQDDGTLLVSGIASSEAVDADGEVITADAMKAALPDYMKFGAIREMHQPIAAGTAIKAEVLDDNKTHLEAKIVDPVSIKKVEEDVLKGFSVGGKVTGRDPVNKATITGIRLTEISLVDRPANPEAVFKLAKVEGADEATLGELRKGMWAVEDFAGLLRQIGWLASDTASEAQWENDNSPVPAQLRDWLAQGAEIFQAMAKEEIEEMLALLPKAPGAEVLAMAAKLAKGELPEDLAKAKKLPATFKAAVNGAHKEASDLHQALGECMGKMAKLWEEAEPEEGEGEAGKAAPAGDLAKAATDLQEALTKAQTLEADLTKANDTIKTHLARIAELEAQPAPPKGVINGNTNTTTKTEADADLQKQAEALSKLPPEEQARLLIKAVHQVGGAIR